METLVMVKKKNRSTPGVVVKRITNTVLNWWRRKHVLNWSIYTGTWTNVLRREDCASGMH